MTKRMKNQFGFAFIELILSTLILSVGLMGGLGLMNTAISHTNNSDYNVSASQLANEKLENIISDKTFNGYDYVDNDNYSDETLSAPYAGFHRSVDVYEVSSADLTTQEANSGYKKVNVVVSWGNEDYETITVSTLLTNY